MTTRHQVRLERVGHIAFEARSEHGGSAVADGKPELGGEGRGMRPTELLLAALGSCSGIDVVHILVNKQKEPLERLRIEVDGERADAVPARFVRIHLRFVANPGVDPTKYARAVALSVEKYCSVRQSLAPDIEVTYEAAYEDGAVAHGARADGAT